ncbi:MAG: 5,10-methylenetetrahydromethanopterin reductase [Nitrososphaerota archaeon]
MSKLSFGIEFLPAKSIEKLVEYAKLSEEVNIDYVWVTDHYNNRNVYATLTAMAYATNSIKLGTGVTNPYVINPCWTASAIATIDEISKGRAVLGIGAGDKITLESIGVKWEEPLKTINEAVYIIKKLLNGERVTFKGKIYEVKNAKLNYKPLKKIPIYIGAQGPKMLALAGSLADGVLINASHPIDFEYATKYIKESLEKREEKIDFFDIVAYTSLSIDENEEKAKEAVKIVVAFIVGGSPQTILERHGIDISKASEISNAISKGDFSKALSLVDEKMLNEFAIAGTPEQIIEKFNELKKMGVTQIVAGSPIGPEVKKSIKLYGEVIKAFK